jgi:toxin YoeB
LQLRKDSKNDYTKCLDLFIDMSDNPRIGIAKPERLKHQNEEEGVEVWSRRINDKDRLVYFVFEATETIVLQTCIGHYGDH